ncbi:MAG: putative PEP-binding protein [Cyanobacteria bacterium J06621_12]
MRDIYWLSQIQYVEQSLVGNELFVLSQLLQHESPILPGFILGNHWWREFSLLINEELSLIEGDVDYQTLQSMARRSRQIINQTAMPSSWQTEIFQTAQQLNSPYLILQPWLTTSSGEPVNSNGLWGLQTCNSTPEALAIGIKSAWSELFSAVSLSYRQKLGLNRDRLNLAILVRPLKNAFASGTINIGKELIQIKATWGLEHSILQGDVEADEYYLERDLGQIVSQYLGHKNYGYRLKNSSLATPVNDCLEAYLPPENLAANYLLNETSLGSLFQLTQAVLKQQPETKYLVWNAFDSEFTQTINFYFTQVSDRPLSTFVATEATSSDPISTAPPLLCGLPVSPGIIQGELAIIPDLDTQSQSMVADSILVTRAIEPHHMKIIKQVKGIITEVGGRNSHGAIVARELNIPAIANATDATKILHNGDRILLNGDRGRVYEATQAASRSTLPGILAPTYPIATKLMVNLSQPESIAATSNLPIDGVGLLRSELMLAELLSDRTLAKWQESFQQQFLSTLTSYLQQFAAAFSPRPVFYRSLDLYERDSSNPVFGDRGTYGYLSDPSLFDLELIALKTVADQGLNNVNLLLPFVRSVDEFEFCYRRLADIGLTTQAAFQVWIMAEVPSVILLLPKYIRAGVQGIAIGTNDLTQLLLGVDREQNQFSDRGLNANHPAMEQAIIKLIETSHQHHIECCICGQAPVEHPELIDRLIQWGIDTISVEPDAVPQTYKAIARAEKKLLLNQVRSNSNPRENS